MNTDPHIITVSGVRVQVIRKPIKNLHLGVYPPAGRVRVAAPLSTPDNAVRLAVIGKLGWIKRQRAKFDGQSRQSEREMVNGESHYLMGRRYRLRLVLRRGPPAVLLRNSTTLELSVRPELSAADRERVLQRWYRDHLRRQIPPLVAKWEKIMEVRAAAWGIKKMKTKWGACNQDTGRIWLNLELAKKPIACLEYLIVHELVHLIERRHGDRFIFSMDKYLPNWRLHRKELNTAPLAYEEWQY
jgi:predicted metal-dependent hydrolase